MVLFHLCKAERDAPFKILTGILFESWRLHLTERCHLKIAGARSLSRRYFSSTTNMKLLLLSLFLELAAADYAMYVWRDGTSLQAAIAFFFLTTRHSQPLMLRLPIAMAFILPTATETMPHVLHTPGRLPKHVITCGPRVRYRDER